MPQRCVCGTAKIAMREVMTTSGIRLTNIQGTNQTKHLEKKYNKIGILLLTYFTYYTFLTAVTLDNMALL